MNRPLKIWLFRIKKDGFEQVYDDKDTFKRSFYSGHINKWIKKYNEDYNKWKMDAQMFY